MKIKSFGILIFTFFFLNFLIKIVLGQVVLPRAEAEFRLNPIQLIEDKDGNIIRLKASLKYLDISWNAIYCEEFDAEGNCTSIIEGQIGARCYLNCPNPNEIKPGKTTPNLTENCGAYKIPGNYKDYVGPSGEATITITDPNYLFKTENNVTCEFYDPSQPEIPFLLAEPPGTYPIRTFRPITFDVSAYSVAVTVGKIELPIKVNNLGLISSNYTVNITPITFVDLVYLGANTYPTRELAYKEVDIVRPEITIKATADFQFKILVKSNLEPVPNFDFSCSAAKPCPEHLGTAECIDGRCWKRTDVVIRAKVTSLPEFDWFGIFQIMLLASAVLILSKKYL